MTANERTAFYKDFVKLCNSVGMSPCRVAEEIGFSKSLISRWKRGGGATDATAMKIAEYFGIQSFEQKHTDRVPVRKIRILRKGVVHDC